MTIEEEILEEFRHFSEFDLTERKNYSIAQQIFNRKYKESFGRINRIDKPQYLLKEPDYTPITFKHKKKLISNRQRDRERVNNIKNDFIDKEIKLYQIFHNEMRAIEYLTFKRWNGNVTCPYCGYIDKVYTIEGGYRFKCGNKSCHKKFSSTVGTLFHGTKLPLVKWFGAMYLLTLDHTKGIPSTQLAVALGITQKTAWYIGQKFNKHLGSRFLFDMNTGIFEYS